MIGIPNPTISSTATYDAWNRLISVTDASTSITNDYDARGFRITETTGGVVRRYYYTPGWQCVEERTGTLTSPERQFVWGMRYIDDLVIRDRSTANNGSINERRYAMQDGNWNTVAICDITGTVGERYAYSAYGTPVFMTGAGTVQASSPIGFETLYAGYRWDNASPQMYYVRNRFLLPQVGTWNKRDPLGYVDGMGLYEYVKGSPIVGADSSGTQLARDTVSPQKAKGAHPDRLHEHLVLQNGSFEVDMDPHINPKTTRALGISGTIRFNPNPDICTPCSGEIKLAQTVKLQVLKDNRWESYQFTNEGVERNKWRTVEDPAKRIFPGYHIDVMPSCQKSIFYRDCTPNSTHSRNGNYNGNGPATSASLWDYPGFPWAADPAKMSYLFYFETCAICESSMEVYGCVHWGFKAMNGKISYSPKPTATSEMSETFKEAIRIYNAER